jgi:hypothetical protein
VANRGDGGTIRFMETLDERTQPESKSLGGRAPPSDAVIAVDESRPEPLWTAHDVARFFQASVSWVYHRAEAGDLPCIHIGGLLRFNPSAIRALGRTEKPSAVRVVKSRR